MPFSLLIVVSFFCDCSDIKESKDLWVRMIKQQDLSDKEIGRSGHYTHFSLFAFNALSEIAALLELSKATLFTVPPELVKVKPSLNET